MKKDVIRRDPEDAKNVKRAGGRTSTMSVKVSKKILAMFKVDLPIHYYYCLFNHI